MNNNLALAIEAVESSLNDNNVSTAKALLSDVSFDKNNSEEHLFLAGFVSAVDAPVNDTVLSGLGLSTEDLVAFKEKGVFPENVAHLFEGFLAGLVDKIEKMSTPLVGSPSLR